MTVYIFGLFAIATVQATQLGQTTMSGTELSNPHSSENDLFKREFKCACGWCKFIGQCGGCCHHCLLPCDDPPKAAQLDQTTTTSKELANVHSREIELFKRKIKCACKFCEYIEKCDGCCRHCGWNCGVSLEAAQLDQTTPAHRELSSSHSSENDLSKQAAQPV